MLLSTLLYFYGQIIEENSFFVIMFILFDRLERAPREYRCLLVELTRDVTERRIYMGGDIRGEFLMF